MSTTTTHQVAGYVITPEQATWTADDWLDSFDGDGYACSVMHAADECTGLLAHVDLVRLLSHHGFEPSELQADIAAAMAAGHQCQAETHAGQALIWLGY